MHPIMVREFNLLPGLSRLSLSNLFGHASFLLLGYSYLTSDLLTLRALAVGGLSAAMVFQFFRPAPLWLPIQWNALFVAINVFWVAKLYYDENFADAYATEEERGLYTRHFSHMPLGEFRQLLKIGKWRDIAPGTELTTEGKANEYVFALVDGEVEVVIGGKHVNSIQAPSFVGEMSLMRSMTGEAGRRSSMTSSSPPKNSAPRVASATVVAQKGVVRVFSWDDKALRRLMRENDVIKSGVHAAVGVGLAEKLLNTRVMSTKMFEKHPREVRGAIAS
jgi:CRP-like cAMP-binding protein